MSRLQPANAHPESAPICDKCLERESLQLIQRTAAAVMKDIENSYPEWNENPEHPSAKLTAKMQKALEAYANGVERYN